MKQWIKDTASLLAMALIVFVMGLAFGAGVTVGLKNKIIAIAPLVVGE